MMDFRDRVAPGAAGRRTSSHPRHRVVAVLAATLLGTGSAVASMALGLGVGAAGASPVFVVTTTVDEHNTGGMSCISADGCSLRAAVEAAVASGGGTIDLGADQTYDLTLGELDLGVNTGESYTINGNGSRVTAVQPGSCAATPDTCVRVFSLDNATVGDESYDLNNLAVSGGEVDAIGGAGVLAGGTGDTYTFTDDTFTGNTIDGPTVGGEADGAGLSVGAASSVVVTNCTFSNNTTGAGASGGGLFIGALDGDALTATVADSSFVNNSTANSTGGGGGFYASAGTTASTFTVTGSVFSDNGATAGGGAADGGGAILADGTGTLDAYSDTFDANSVTGSGEGGAVNVVSGTANLAANSFGDDTAAATDGQTLAVDGDNSPAVTAEDNWWSSNSGPSVTDLSGVTVTNYLVLRVAASPTPVFTGLTTTVTADLTHDQSGTSYTDHSIPDGTAVAFGGTAGSYLGGTSGTTSNGQSSDTMTTGGGGVFSPDGVTATVDGVTADATLAVNSTLVQGAPTSDTVVAGTVYSEQLVVSNPPPDVGTITWNTTTGAPPVTVASSSGVVTAPSTTPVGDYDLSGNLSDDISDTGHWAFDLDVAMPTVGVTSPGDQSDESGAAITPVTVDASDNSPTATLTFSDGGTLPPGLSIDFSSGTVSGTPTTAGDYTVTITATDSFGAVGTTTFGWTIANTIHVVAPEDQRNVRGVAVTPLVVAASDSSSSATLSYSDGGTLPPGLSIDSSSGTVSGTPTTFGTYSVTITVSDGTGASNTATFDWTIKPANWLTPTNQGRTHVHEGAAEGFYLGLLHGDDAWTVDLTQSSTDSTRLYTGTLTVDHGSFTDVVGLKVAPSDRLTVSPDGSTITFRFFDHGGLHGLTFDTPPTATVLTMALDIDGTPAPTSEVFLGPAKLHPSRNPLVIHRRPL